MHVLMPGQFRTHDVHTCWCFAQNPYLGSLTSAFPHRTWPRGPLHRPLHRFLHLPPSMEIRRIPTWCTPRFPVAVEQDGPWLRCLQHPADCCYCALSAPSSARYVFAGQYEEVIPVFYLVLLFSFIPYAGHIFTYFIPKVLICSAIGRQRKLTTYDTV